jgi:hypothetical protein
MRRPPGTVWADVTWSYGSALEHICYQLVERPNGLQIAPCLLTLSWCERTPRRRPRGRSSRSPVGLRHIDLDFHLSYM